MKDIDKYWDKYIETYSFEEEILIYREKKILDHFKNYNPKKILEIGCGFSPVSLKYNNFDNLTLIEPGLKAYNHINKKYFENKKVKCYHSTFEEALEEICNAEFDFIVCNGVLHEISDPNYFLSSLGKIMGKGTNVYINVPNANSLHRILAVEMGLIKNVFEKSDRNSELLQNTNFDKEKLISIIKKNILNIKIKDCSTFLIKPFTHEQMMLSIKNNILNRKVIEALYSISSLLPENGSEISFLFCKNL